MKQNKSDRQKKIYVLILVIAIIVFLIMLAAYALDYEFSHNFPIVLGILLGILISSALILYARKGKLFEAEYDERQLAENARADKLAFRCAIIEMFVIASIDVARINVPVENSVLLILAIVISAGIEVTIRIMNDSYFALNESKKRYGIGFALVGVLNVYVGISALINRGAFKNGKISFEVSNLLCGVFILYIGIILFVKYLIDRKEEADEES